MTHAMILVVPLLIWFSATVVHNHPKVMVAFPVITVTVVATVFILFIVPGILNIENLHVTWNPSPVEISGSWKEFSSAVASRWNAFVRGIASCFSFSWYTGMGE